MNEQQPEALALLDLIEAGWPQVTGFASMDAMNAHSKAVHALQALRAQVERQNDLLTEAWAKIENFRGEQVERLQAAHVDVPEGWRLVMVEAGTAPDEPDWDEVRRQAEVTTGLKVERNTYSIVIREVRRWLTQRATPAPSPAPVAQESDERMTDSARAWLEGMSVSVDVGTGDDDIGHRYFGTVTEVMDDPNDKHGVTLLVQDAKPNFDRAGQVAAPAMVPLPTEYIKRVREGSPGRRFLHFGLPELIEVTRAIEAASAKLNGLTVGGSKASGGAE